MPGFTFWGLFVACGLIVVGYVVWMTRVERSERGAHADAPGEVDVR